MPNQNGKMLDKLTTKNILYLLIIGVLFIILCIYDLRWVIPSIILYAGVLIYSVWNSSRKKSEIVSHIEEITADVNSATKATMINSPIPLVVIETSGTIIWKSRKFVDEFQNLDISTYLTSIIKEIKLDLEKNENTEISKSFNINKKVYRIRGGLVKNQKRNKKGPKEYTLILYFIDETKYNELFDTYNNSKPCIGMAMIDNYEDIVKRAIPEEKLDLLAKIEKQIINWVTRTGGVIIKTERDSFVFIMEQQYLPVLESEKFDVLDKIKTIGVDSNIQITLSIAVSTEGDTIYGIYKSALAAMEIVLGRGGDQAVVRKDGKYKFYGGTSLEIEKRTKVKARIMANSISDAIENSSKVLIMGHQNIDIDSFGSALGMYRLAKTIGKECHIVSEPVGKGLGKFLDVFNSQEEYKEVIVSEQVANSLVDEDTLLIIVDTHKRSYVEFPDLLEKIHKKIIIDHHRKGPDYIDDAMVSFHEVYASSAAELVTEIIQYAPEPVKLEIIEAESLYGGIMVDTKDFTFKTGVRTFEAAAYLRKYGVDIIRVKKWFQADLESYNKIADIVKNVEIINKSIAISVFENKENNKDANLICAKGADELLTISDITASFVMTDIDGKIYISGRSIGDINVQLILEKLGGGGHITLAGAQLEGFTLEDAKDELIIRINEYFTEIE